MAAFTQVQLNTMTLDELERYHNLDPNDLDTCHALIAAQARELEDCIHKDEVADNYYTVKEYDDLQEDLYVTIEDLHSQINDHLCTIDSLQAKADEYE